MSKEVRKKFRSKDDKDAMLRKCKDNSIRSGKAGGFDRAYLKSLEYTLFEWHSKEDDDAFQDLQNC